MEIGLFHYLPNGLMFRDFKTGVKTHKCKVVHPETWDSRDIE